LLIKICITKNATFCGFEEGFSVFVEIKKLRNHINKNEIFKERLRAIAIKSDFCKVQLRLSKTRMLLC